MKKAEFIERYGEATWERHLAQGRAWKEDHPEKSEEANRQHSRKSGGHYSKYLKYKATGVQGEKNKIRAKHGLLYRPYKNIIAPDSQIHHSWIPRTSAYSGVALVEADQHRHGIIDVIRILEGKITHFTEQEIRDQVI